MKTKCFLFIAALAFVAVMFPIHSSSGAQSTLAAAPWPMFRHDLHHTGRSDLYGPRSPALRWRYATGGAVRSSPAVAADGTVYVGSDDGYLYALNPNGRLRWRYHTGAAVESSPAIALDGTVYVGSNDNYVYALNPSGSLKWRFFTIGMVHSSPAIAVDGTIYVNADCIRGYNEQGEAIVSADNPLLYALCPDGTQRWSYTLGTFPRGTAHSSPAVGDDGTVYIGTPTGEILALNPDGSRKWMLWYVSTHVLSSPAVADDGRIWVGCEYKGCLIRVEANGTWGTCLGNICYGCDVTSSPAIGADGTIYYGVDSRGSGFPGAAAGYLAALDPAATSNDYPTWACVAGNAVDSSPAIGADGTVYVGACDTYVYAVASNGSLRWRFKTGGSVSSSPAIAPDCRLYFGSEDGYVYALDNGVTLQSGVDDYAGSEDTYLYAQAPNTNYCTDNQFIVGYKQQQVGLLRFDISSIPASAHVLRATLQTWASGWSGADMTIEAYRVVRDVNLCQATWNQAASGNNWAQPGGNDSALDREATPECAVTTHGIRTWYGFGLTGLVQAWVNGSVANHGVLLRGASAWSTLEFHFASNQADDTSLHPRLEVIYCLEVPLPPDPTPTITVLPTPSPTPSQEYTVTLQYLADDYYGSADTHLFQYAPSTNYGLASQISVGYKRQYAGLLRFDLPMGISRSAHVIEARLQLYATGWGGSSMEMDVFRVLRESMPYEATWEVALEGRPWEVAGAEGASDRGQTAESRVTLRGPRQWYSLTVTALVQDWLTGAVATNSVLLRGASASSTSQFYFASNEGGQASQCPKLVIHYRLAGAP